MTGRERIDAVLHKKVPDRIPVFPNVHFGTARMGGFTIREFATDGKKHAACLIGAYRECGYDGIQVGCDVAIEGEAVGSRVEYPEDGVPSVKEPFLREPRIDALKIPNPYRDGRMPVIIESTRIVAGEVSKEVFIASAIMGPLNSAAQIRGIDNILMDFYDRTDFVDELLDFCVELGVAYGKALIEAGADCILLGEALCSPNVISPSFYERFVLEKEKRLIRELSAAGAGSTILHICGNIAKILTDCSTTGTKIIDIDWQMDIGRVIDTPEIWEAGIAARGNINPSGVLLNGAPEDVFAEAKGLLEANKGNGRFILSSGCNMQPGSVPEHLRAMVKAAEAFG